MQVCIRNLIPYVEFFQVIGNKNIQDLDDVVMVESVQDGNFSEDSLAVNEVFENAVDFFNCHNALLLVVVHFANVPCRGERDPQECV